MTEQHQITPPPELVEEWLTEWMSNVLPGTAPQYIATQAARWASDQELEACCQWLSTRGPGMAVLLRAARRPKPPSLAEQALLAHRRIWNEGINHTDCGLILRALERLQELENNG